MDSTRALEQQVAEWGRDIDMLQSQLDIVDEATRKEIARAIAWRREKIAEVTGVAPPTDSDGGEYDDGDHSGGEREWEQARGRDGGRSRERRHEATHSDDDTGAGSPAVVAAAAPAAVGEMKTLTEDQLRELFDFYANFGRSSVMSYQDSIDSFMFMKLAKECPELLGDDLTRTDVDLIFTKAKPKFHRRLTFENFLDALSAIAARKYPKFSPADGLRLLLHRHLVPLYGYVRSEMSKTSTDVAPVSGIFARLTDVNQYTGVYKQRFVSGDGRINGDTVSRVGNRFVGNTNTGTDEVIHDISVLMRPHLHGRGTAMTPFNHESVTTKLTRDPRSVTRPATRRVRSVSPSARRRAGGASSPPSRATHYDMAGRPRRSSGGRASTGSSSVVTPSSPAAPPAPPVAVPTEALLAAVAQARSGHPDALCDLTLSLAAQIQGISASTDGGVSLRSAADVAAPPPPYGTVHQAASPPSLPSEKPRGRRAAAAASRREGDGGGGASAPTASGSAEADSAPPSSPTRGRPVSPRRGTTLTQDQIMEIFEYYCNFGRSSVMTHMDTMDSFMFMKFCRECPGLMDKVVTRTEVDLIFTKAKPKFERRLSFAHFLDALSAIAEKKYPDASATDGLRMLLTNNLVPMHSRVEHEMAKTGETEVPLEGAFARLYDVKSYTGVYKSRFISGDGRINGDVETRVGRSFTGNTNTGTDETIHDISVLMRPNLRGGTMMSPKTHDSPSPAKHRSVSPRRR